MLITLQQEYPDIEIKPILHPLQQYILDNKQAIGWGNFMAFVKRKVTSEEILDCLRKQIDRYKKTL